MYVRREMKGRLVERREEMFMRQERRSEEAWILRRVYVLLLLELKKLKVEIEVVL